MFATRTDAAPGITRCRAGTRFGRLAGAAVGRRGRCGVVARAGRRVRGRRWCGRRGGRRRLDRDRAGHEDVDELLPIPGLEADLVRPNGQRAGPAEADARPPIERLARRHVVDAAADHDPDVLRRAVALVAVGDLGDDRRGRRPDGRSDRRLLELGRPHRREDRCRDQHQQRDGAEHRPQAAATCAAGPGDELGERLGHEHEHLRHPRTCGCSVENARPVRGRQWYRRPVAARTVGRSCPGLVGSAGVHGPDGCAR